MVTSARHVSGSGNLVRRFVTTDLHAPLVISFCVAMVEAHPPKDRETATNADAQGSSDESLDLTEQNIAEEGPESDVESDRKLRSDTPWTISKDSAFEDEDTPASTS